MTTFIWLLDGQGNGCSQFGIEVTIYFCTIFATNHLFLQGRSTFNISEDEVTQTWCKDLMAYEGGVHGSSLGPPQRFRYLYWVKEQILTLSNIKSLLSFFTICQKLFWLSSYFFLSYFLKKKEIFHKGQKTWISLSKIK
jgi:hypothetical protein